MNSIRLSTKIKILEDVLSILKEKRCVYGLCHLMSNVSARYTTRITMPNISKVFVHFTHTNALKFKAKKSILFYDYWWSISPFDYESRIDFTEWMIAELRKEQEQRNLNKEINEK
jgi:hypothetical protein